TSISPRVLPTSSTLCPYTTLFRSGTEHARTLDQGLLGQQHATHVRVDDDRVGRLVRCGRSGQRARLQTLAGVAERALEGLLGDRSEEHTSELQSRENLVCRLLLEI